jgi:hypothetical protein
VTQLTLDLQWGPSLVVLLLGKVPSATATSATLLPMLKELPEKYHQEREAGRAGSLQFGLRDGYPVQEVALQELGFGTGE